MKKKILIVTADYYRGISNNLLQKAKLFFALLSNDEEISS